MGNEVTGKPTQLSLSLLGGGEKEGVGSSAVKYLTRLSQEGKCIWGGTGTPAWLLAFWHYSSCLPDAHVCKQDFGNGSRGDDLLQTGKKAESAGSNRIPLSTESRW